MTHCTARPSLAVIHTVKPELSKLAGCLLAHFFPFAAAAADPRCGMLESCNMCLQNPSLSALKKSQNDVNSIAPAAG